MNDENAEVEREKNIFFPKSEIPLSGKTPTSKQPGKILLNYDPAHPTHSSNNHPTDNLKYNGMSILMHKS
jgi:hypothetical protein